MDSEDMARAAAVEMVKGLFGCELNETLKKAVEEQALLQHKKKLDVPAKPTSAKIKEATGEVEQASKAFVKQERLLEKQKAQKKKLLEELAKVDENITSTMAKREEALAAQNDKMAALEVLHKQQEQEEQQKEEDDEDMLGTEDSCHEAGPKKPRGSAVVTSTSALPAAKPIDIKEIEAQINALQATLERARQEKETEEGNDTCRLRNGRSRSPRNSASVDEVKAAAKSAAAVQASGN